MFQQYKKSILTFALATLALLVQAQSPQVVFNTVTPPLTPKIQVSWNRLYDHAGINEICYKLAQTYPDLVRLETVGDSYGGRRIVALIISDFRTGNPDRKPAFYVDSNIRGNEVQGAEYALYTAWFLAESFSENAFIQELLQQKTFYIIPVLYPYARDLFIHGGTTENTYRTGMISADDDGDGLMDEDQPEDINQDGIITVMRRRSSKGKYLVDPQNPNKMILAQPGQPGEYELLGVEGIDNDGDGKINEDPDGYYDPNRDWAWNWQPEYEQPGAFKYPFSIPENRHIKEFIYRHPNIAGAQDFRDSQNHNSGLAAETSSPAFSSEDELLREQFRQQAETIIPGYGYIQIDMEQEQSYGRKQGWFNSMRGIQTFALPLMSPYLALSRRQAPGQEPNLAAYQWNSSLLFPNAIVNWTAFEHATLGPIEIGGFNEKYLRDQYGFLAEEEAHRNMVFTLFHAYQTPHLEIQEVKTKLLPGGMTEVTATIANTRLMPTHSSHDIKHKIERPDYAILRDTNVVAGYVTEFNGQKINKEQKNFPNKIELQNIPGLGYVKVKWVLKSAPPILEVEVDSRKGGTATKRF